MPALRCGSTPLPLELHLRLHDEVALHAPIRELELVALRPDVHAARAERVDLRCRVIGGVARDLRRAHVPMCLEITQRSAVGRGAWPARRTPAPLTTTVLSQFPLVECAPIVAGNMRNVPISCDFGRSSVISAARSRSTSSAPGRARRPRRAGDRGSTAGRSSLARAHAHFAQIASGVR